MVSSVKSWTLFFGCWGFEGGRISIWVGFEATTSSW